MSQQQEPQFSDPPSRPAHTPDSQPRPSSNKRGPRNSRAKNVPPGAIKVPAGGSKYTGKASTPVSTAIPISGWGESDLSSFRRDIRPTFTPDPAPYVDLVNVVYTSLTVKYANGKHLPRSFFVYICALAWWYRVLYVHQNNGNALTPDLLAAWNALSGGDSFNLPSPIAQYLANMGNFYQGGEQFYLEAPKFRFTAYAPDEVTTLTVKRGWLLTSADDGVRVSNSDEFWAYTQTLVPGIYANNICNEAGDNSPLGFAPRLTLEAISPIAPANRVVQPTANINCWDVDPVIGLHSSWRSAYSLLGWSRTTAPADLQTCLNISTSTIKWTSDKLATMTGLKLHLSSQLHLSTTGNPIQAYYLGTDTGLPKAPHFERAATSSNRYRGTLNSELVLLSRYSMDDKMLLPSFCFGYRFQRFRCTRPSTSLGEQVLNVSPFQPWVYYNSNGNQADMPLGFEALNYTFNFGSSDQLNTPRFGTHPELRSTVLDTSLCLDSPPNI